MYNDARCYLTEIYRSKIILIKMLAHCITTRNSYKLQTI